MSRLAKHPLLLGALTAGLLILPFPIAGPVPEWRTFFGWIAFVPLLYAVLGPAPGPGGQLRKLTQGGLLRSAAAAYIAGVLWYLGNCYWIYQTMLYYGGLPPLVSAGILLAYSLILGLYFAAFGLLLALVARGFGRAVAGLAAAPFLWVALEWAAAHITKVPWDQLGYSQIDNFLLTPLATVTGVYGISWLVMAANAVIAAGLVAARSRRTSMVLLAGGLLGALLVQNGYRLQPPPAPVEAAAVLVQVNLNVDQDNRWFGADYDAHVARFIALSGRTCAPYLKGTPELDARWIWPDCVGAPVQPDLVVWPESPAPFRDKDARFRGALRAVALAEHAAVVSGNVGLDVRTGARADRSKEDQSKEDQSRDMYNSALVVAPDGGVVGRYDKIHLVPWGEYVPFQDFFAFAKNLTQQAGDMTHGWRRMVFTTKGHTFGVFICYEEIFADEVRQFVELGAQVLVNISDDGWYGDTCAPWQTLNMSRMRAVENRRWLLRDTNTGITTIIDPYGRLTASAPRHALTSLAGRFGYRSDLTFYTVHGDLFAMLCGIISLAVVARALRSELRLRPPTHSQRQVPGA